jgi:predicted aspartyl protease
LAKEALPQNWNSDVRVEEFTNFILLVTQPPNTDRVSVTKAAEYLKPILKYCDWCLSDVAFFDHTHRSFIFFDKEILTLLSRGENLSLAMIEKVKSQGSSFTQFNSVKIKCEKQESHLFLPLEVAGPSGVVSCYALLDTGASMTMLSNKIIAETGYDHLESAQRKTFSTPNGRLVCPIVQRQINIEGFQRNINIAVNQNDDLNLLGLNYFGNLKYIIDVPNSCVYIWEK